MTTATRSNAQNRNVPMLTAYMLAFILPLMAISFAYMGMSIYCKTTTNDITAPRLCIGLQQFQGNAFTLPSVH